MFRTSMKHLLSFAVIAAAGGEVSVAAAEVLVLRTDGPTARRQFRIGARLPDAAIFRLRAGDTLTVLARGGTRTFRGPGAFSVVMPPRGQRLVNGVAVRVQTGVVRTELRLAGIDPTDIWEYDARESGNVCVRAGSRPVLWRPASHAATRITIRTLAGEARSFDWPAGQTSFAWPAGLPVSDRATYTLSWNSDAHPARITTILLPAMEADNLDTLASTFIRNQCNSQLDTFIATRPDPEARPSGEPPPAPDRPPT